MNPLTEIAPVHGATDALAEDLSQLHNRLREKYENVNPEEITTDSSTSALMSFNGYYALDILEGAFFTVDTNMVVINGGTPVYDISLIISLNGQESYVYPFTGTKGTFDGTRLVINAQAFSPGVPNLDLTFERGNAIGGPTAILSGTIALPNEAPVEVSGVTYNNIIPMDMYEGLYYDKILGIFEDPIMQIGADYSLKYKPNTVPASMETVSSFIYNMNMYFFSFYQGDNLVKLIMGTSAQGGLECNNMIVPQEKGGKLQKRSLQTVKKTTIMNTTTDYNANSKTLANYAGFYLLSSPLAGVVEKGAFISIEGIYEIATAGADPVYHVVVGYSLNGTSTEVYTIDTTMTFESNTLTIPTADDKSIVINFNPGYVPSGNGQFGTLVTISADINGVPVNGRNPLNPVPLRAFRGVTMTNPSNQPTETLTVHSDTKISYNGTSYEAFTYVPVMYILAFDISKDNVTVLSLGTYGGKGTACIVINKAGTVDSVTTSVFGIPDGATGEPNIPH